jgi:hypothetical protein
LAKIETWRGDSRASFTIGVRPMVSRMESYFMAVRPAFVQAILFRAVG